MSTVRTVEHIAHDLRAATTRLRELEEQYEEARRPYKEALKRLELHYKPDLEWLEAHVRGLREELLRAIAPNNYEGLPKGVGLRWTHRVIVDDVAALPKEYVEPNMTALNNDLRRLGPELWEVPGTHVERVPVLMVFREKGDAA